ncbi:nucleolar pre-ribosomal-associated protein 2 [Podospora australis]|uniref:Nucleolar pre-ribosomal-associated protein 2 n=1 Tax=Podospora australis TaxID=1536484 RepID=A0AAN6WY82_9PEZI|nr:nucleolar pre-ribosomal-associated protein 2 [Podospora australis]
MGGDYKTGEATLIRAVRALDQGDVETIPERLERVWDTLSEYHGGSFHAAEEMLLRWLLKNMTGTTANAERVRRYALTWDILGAVFALVPLFSLAKSLADRRFINILQQTLKEIAKPAKEDAAQTNGTTSEDVEMANAPGQLESPSNPRKRKRTSSSVGFNVVAQRKIEGCLQTAEAVFEALRVLLSRCEVKSLEGLPTHRMGAEHVKSLFSFSATEAMEILVPVLTLCGLAVDKPTAGLFKEQSSWLSTFNAIWELHLQGSDDATEVATHLSHPGARLLGKLTGVPQQVSVGIESATQERWVRDLRRFLNRNLILPARAAFLNKDSQGIIKTAVSMCSVSAPICFPVLFDLVTRSPREFGGNTSIKGYESWVQSVFDAMLHAASVEQAIDSKKGMAAIRSIMELAAARNAALTAPSLRKVCKEYALRADGDDWSLLLSIVKLNPDVFLLSDEGKELLNKILEKTRNTESLSEGDSEKAGHFIVLLADGYAQARDLTSFVKTWLEYLVPADPKAGLQSLWAQKELADTVSSLLQSSLNANQLADLVSWLSAQPATAARTYILGSISSGISQEEFIDAANMSSFKGVFAEKVSKKDPPSLSACRWEIAAKTLGKGTLEEAIEVWTQVGSDLKKTLKKSPIQQEDTFAAFKCCVATWLANHPGAKHEEEAAKLVCSFLERLGKSSDAMEVDSDKPTGAITNKTYLSWILSDSPLLFSMIVERTGELPEPIVSLLKPNEAEDITSFDPETLQTEHNFNTAKLIPTLIDTIIPLVDTSKSARLNPSTKAAVQFLLESAEALDRRQRGAVMKSLMMHLPQTSDKAEAIGMDFWKPVLSLMVKLMEEPTYYEGMDFSHLEAIGRCLLKIHRRSNRRSRGDLVSDDVPKDRENFRLLHQLAIRTVKQMVHGKLEDREKAYMSNAVQVLKSQSEDADIVLRIILLRAFRTAVREPGVVKKLEEAGLDAKDLKDNALLQTAVSTITSGKWRGKGLLSGVIALEALNDLDRAAVKEGLASAVPTLLETSNSLIENGVEAGWDVRIFLANHFPDSLGSPFKVKMSLGTVNSEEDNNSSTEAVGNSALRQYVDAVVKNTDEKTKLNYLQDVLLDQYDAQDALGRLVVIDQLVSHLRGSRPSEATANFDLAKAHSILCKSLPDTLSPSASAPANFLVATETIRSLLDQSPMCMTQWNIELTLSTVSIISNTSPSTTSPPILPALCSLIEAIIKRHRQRLDGHFHLLITALQSLLRLLLTSSSLSPIVWESHAKTYSRLLTLICEPTVASVSRAKTTGLDSEKNRARRYAGQYMYFVLMQYIKLQLTECASSSSLPHGVREALEKGIYSIVRITTEDSLKIMNESMDPSGRVVFKELYKRFQMFAQWKGV